MIQLLFYDTLLKCVLTIYGVVVRDQYFGLTADFTVESERLGGQLALFLVEKAGLEAEASGSRVVFKCEPNVQLGHLRIFLNDFMQKFNVRGKVKARGEDA
jgi:hypothetical protein